MSLLTSQELFDACVTLFLDNKTKVHAKYFILGEDAFRGKENLRQSLLFVQEKCEQENWLEELWVVAHQHNLNLNNLMDFRNQTNNQ